ncbi:MAG TPA: TonB-dependent receptor [Flavisolibacter sp.]|nr:TonB-dependent receptor [Flavisolibacter sp.]
MRKFKTVLVIAFLCTAQLLWAQTKIITGKVTDEKDGLPIAGATVTVRSTNATTITDANGTFSIQAAENAVLVISSIGYAGVELPVSRASAIRLAQGANALSEVVVVGYGTKIKRDVTSSISKITNRDFQNLPLPSFESALQGRAAGVFINQGSGKLGQGLNVRVRGISSISANQQPFIVIDGVPVVSQSLGSSTEPDNPLSTLNPDDIESMEVLKDAASSAIYGARASNGVILITTKSGKAGKTRVNFGVFTGWSEPTKKQKFLNATQYKELFTAAAVNEGYDPAVEFEAETGTQDWGSSNDVNWANEAFQKGGITQYNLSVTGGDARTKFLLSGSLNEQKGIILLNKLNRGTVRLNLDHNLSSRIRFGANLSLTKSDNFRVPGDNAFTNPLQLNAIPPLHALRGSDGKYSPATLYYNVLIEKDASQNLSKTYRSISSAFGEVTISPSFMFRSQVGVDLNNLQEEQWEGKETLDGAPGGLSYQNQVTSTITTFTNTLNYRKTLSTKFDVDGLAGIEYQRGNTSGASVQGRAFPNNRFTKIASAAIIESGSSTQTEFSFVSYFARGNFKFNDRYLLGASFRVDGSSRFGRDNRYGAFPSVSAGWILSEESFLKSSSFLSFLKFRTSYGRTGNAEIGNFSSLTLYSASAYADVAGLIASQIGVPNLSWEKTDQFDAGLDFGLFNNRISGEIDYFKKNTKDLLLDVPVQAVNGFTTITKNIGSMENKGWEFVLNGNVLTGAFRWTVSANVSTYKNKVTKLVAPVPPGQRTLGRLAIGRPFGEFYGKKYAGVDAANGDALYLKADGSTTNVYSEGVDTIVGNPNPDYYGGFNNRFSYKGFDLDVQCQFVSGSDIYNIAGFFQSVNGDYFDNQTVDQMDFWKKAGDQTSIPKPRLYAGNGAGKSSRWVQDGSYFRVKTVNFGYTLPRKWMSRARIESARIYVAANNLFTSTKYKGYDPEVNTTYIGNINLGHDFYTPPQARTISVGINLGF